MERRTTLLLLLLTLLSLTSYTGVSAAKTTYDPCSSTLYPYVCKKSLYVYAASIRSSPRRAAKLTLSIGLLHAQSAFTYVNSLSSSAKHTTSGYAAAAAVAGDAVGVCMENMKDSVAQLQNSIWQMGKMGRLNTPGYEYRLDNIKTWASAALTDATTCLDTIAASDMDAAVKAAVQKKVVMVVQVTSNALALVNQISTNGNNN